MGAEQEHPYNKKVPVTKSMTKQNIHTSFNGKWTDSYAALFYSPGEIKVLYTTSLTHTSTLHADQV